MRPTEASALSEHAPYDRISVAATAPQIPESLKQQLTVGGKMILPVGRDRQELLLVTRKNGGFKVEEKMGVVFVPLIGVEGFKEQVQRSNSRSNISARIMTFVR